MNKDHIIGLWQHKVYKEILMLVYGISNRQSDVAKGLKVVCGSKKHTETHFITFYNLEQYYDPLS